MRTVICRLIMILGAATALAEPTRLSSFGSNPYLSWQMFPQEIAAWHGNFISYSPSYENAPYWGDIDEPLNRPNGNYTSTGIDVVDENGASFRHTGKRRLIGNGFAYAHRFTPQTTAQLDFSYDLDSRYNGAEGTLVYNEDSSALPFDYRMAHTLNFAGIQGILAFNAFGTPAGIRVKVGMQNTLALNQDLRFTKDGVTYESDRTLWGWSTSPCAHIFGATGVQGDAWLQDGYSRGPMYNFDVQAGVSLGVGRVGARFAYQTGHQDYYRWERAADTIIQDTVVRNNFAGGYVKDNWSRTFRDMTIRAYGDIPFMKNSRGTLAVFLLLGYDGLTRGEALSANLAVADDARDQTRGLVVEVEPNLQIPFESAFSYIDVGVRVGYGYSRRNNLYQRWVGGGRIETYRDATVNGHDEDMWEGYSYANLNNADVGLDINTMFPLLTSGEQRLGLGVTFLLDASLSSEIKYFGRNLDQGTDVKFVVDNKRYNLERQVEFSTGVKLQYRRRPFLAWFEVSEPLLRAVKPRTRITDAAGGNVSFEHEKSPLWMSMEGIQAGLFLSCEMTMPFLRNLRSPSEDAENR